MVIFYWKTVRNEQENEKQKDSEMGIRKFSGFTIIKEKEWARSRK